MVFCSLWGKYLAIEYAAPRAVNTQKLNEVDINADFSKKAKQLINRLLKYAELEAIASCNQALNRAPDHIYAHNNKGLALQSLGNLQAGLSQQEEAIKNYEAALAEFNRSLEIAPDDEKVRNIRDELQELLDSLKST